MKNQTKNFKRRMNIIGTLLFAIITFMLVAPISLGLASFLAIGALFMPIIVQYLPAGILGEGTPAEKELEKKNKDAQDALLLKIKNSNQEFLDDFMKNNPEIKSFKTSMDAFNTLQEKAKTFKTAEDLKLVTDELAKIALDVKAMKDMKISQKGFKKGSVSETLALNKEKIAAFVAAKSGTLQLEHKATETSTDIGSGDSVYSGNTLGRDAYFTWHEGGAIGTIPVRKPFMRDLFKKATTGSEFIKYIDQDTIVRDAKNVALCNTSTHNSKVTFKVRTLNVDKVRDFTTVCLDMMDDYGFVGSEINNLINTDLQLKIDNDLLLGTGVSPILHGLTEIASTFSASLAGADYTGKVKLATVIDLISTAGAQIRFLGQWNKWMPNAVLMNPYDVQIMKVLKNSFGDYLKNPSLMTTLFQDTAGNLYVDGMLIVENPLVTVNTFWIGDFQRGTVYARPGVGIEFAYENGTNFEQELVTVKAYERLNLLIRNVDKNAFMTCADITAGVGAISAPTI